MFLSRRDGARHGSFLALVYYRAVFALRGGVARKVFALVAGAAFVMLAVVVMAFVEFVAKMRAANLVGHVNVASFEEKAKALAVGLHRFERGQAGVGPFLRDHFGLDLRVQQNLVALKLGVVVGLKVGVGGLFKFGRFWAMAAMMIPVFFILNSLEQLFRNKDFLLLTLLLSNLLVSKV